MTHLTHFGFRTVPSQEKASLVQHVFSSVAHRYDLINDVLTVGLHRAWKRRAVRIAAPVDGTQALDLACGTGDIARLLMRKVGDSGEVVLGDFNPTMLDATRARFANRPAKPTITITQADAEDLPFADDTFDLITIGFGLRNLTDPQQALGEMLRVLRPGGKLVVLEFSTPTNKVVSKLYDVYSFSIVPLVGGILTNDAQSYRYLVESIRMHPDQDTLMAQLEDGGLVECGYRSMSAGIVAVHWGYKAA